MHNDTNLHPKIASLGLVSKGLDKKKLLAQAEAATLSKRSLSNGVKSGMLG
ncbi:MAG: hypothetical protein KME21_18935 [Desmonostoc vinosum HA7617-LM4]|nr:hypothetical protein [Desmonostoc vinosum HA7617-LM4]